MSSVFRRRHFLQAAGGTALVAAAGCSTRTANSPSTNSGVDLPTYVPFDGIRPDLAPNKDGLEAGYLHYPENPKSAITHKPGGGAEFTAMAAVYGAVPPPIDKNRYWAALNERLGVNLKFNAVPIGDYVQKFAAVVAGGDIPDCAQILLFGGPPAELPGLLASQFQDLSEFLAGDAVKEYPFLANIPPDHWRPTVYNGGIYCLPVPRPVIRDGMLVRTDRVSNSRPSSFAEFLDVCEESTDAKRNRWALANPATAVVFIQEMLHAPNGWREAGGRFTSALEADETKQAIDTVAKMWKAGLFHPDSFTADTPQLKQWFAAGTIAIYRDGLAGWGATLPAELQQHVGAMPAPGYDGGKGVAFAGLPTFSLTAIKKAGAARVRELLRVLNWLAAPFGTAEHLFRMYGLPDVHHTISAAGPVKTELGTTQVALPVTYLTDAPPVVYEGAATDLTQRKYAFKKEAIAVKSPDPTVGLFSDTFARTGARLMKNIDDVKNSILAGREPLSAWDDAVSQWRREGGDAVRREYEEAFQKNR